MSIDYPATCPDIDKAKENFKQILEDHLTDFLSEIIPAFVNTTEAKDLITQVKGFIYSDSEDIFESVRTTNSDLRFAAESQLDSLQDEIDDRDNELSDAYIKIDSLEEENNTLSKDIYDKETIISDLESELTLTYSKIDELLKKEEI